MPPPPTTPLLPPAAPSSQPAGFDPIPLPNQHRSVIVPTFLLLQQHHQQQQQHLVTLPSARCPSLSPKASPNAPQSPTRASNRSCRASLHPTQLLQQHRNLLHQLHVRTSCIKILQASHEHTEAAPVVVATMPARTSRYPRWRMIKSSKPGPHTCSEADSAALLAR